MSIHEKFDPISITARVRERLDKKIKGLTPESTAASQQPISTTTSEAPLEDHQNDLQGKFLELLMNPPTVEPKEYRTERPVATQFEKSSQIFGTKNYFSPQNKCEEREEKSISRKSDFSFSLDGGPLGAMKLAGTFDGSVMQVRLSTQDALSVQQITALETILQRQLSRTLGVKVEFSIDRTTNSG